MNVDELWDKYKRRWRHFDGEKDEVIIKSDFAQTIAEIISLPVEAKVSDAKSGLTPDQIELRLLEKIADDIAIRDYPSLSKTSKSIILNYFEKLIKEKTDSFLSR